jgi:dienelactone hydrolase
MACRDCFRGGIHTHATPVGYMTTLYDTNCYISPGIDATQQSSSATPPNLDFSRPHILYLCDGFGLALVNNKLLADRYAAETGFTVIAPDVPPGGGLHIDALALTDTITDPVAWTDVLGQLWRVWAVMRMVPIALPFVLRKKQRDESKAAMILLARKLKEAMSAKGAGAKLGIAGFCYGGWLATGMANAPLDPKVEGAAKGENLLVDAVFVAHPSWLKLPDDIVAPVKHGVPYSAALGDKDMTLPLDKAEELEAALRQQVGEPEVNNYEVRIYRENIPHGFAVRAREGFKEQIEAEHKACEQAVSWFKKTLT